MELGKAVWKVAKGWLSSDWISRKTHTSGCGEGKSEGRLRAWQWESGCKIKSAMGYFNVLVGLDDRGHDGTRMRKKGSAVLIHFSLPTKRGRLCLTMEDLKANIRDFRSKAVGASGHFFCSVL